MMPLANTYHRIDLIPPNVQSLTELHDHRVRVVHIYLSFRLVLRVCHHSNVLRYPAASNLPGDSPPVRDVFWFARIIY